MRRNGTLKRPAPRRSDARRLLPGVERVESRILLATFTVINTKDDTNPGSLRWAIGQSNATAGSNTIDFSIAASGVQTIGITSALPAITVPVTINGLTEPGTTLTPLIELDGVAAGNSVDGLDVKAGNSTLEGLVINRFKGEGINLSLAGSDTIQGDFLGTDPTGTIIVGNGLDGLLVQANSNGNTILGNLISGNVNNGIFLNGSGGQNTATSGNLIVGNTIGTDVTGTLALGNQNDGITVQNAPLTTVGGTTAMGRNILSGNGTGIELFGNSDGSVVEGNYIGTDVTGEVALGNNGAKGFFHNNLVFRGISNSTIGGTAAGAGNVISGGAHFGLDSFGNGSGIAIQGNLIGTDATGTKPLGNKDGGLVIFPTNTTIGGTVQGARNVISANGTQGGTGIYADSGGLVIQGNYIGTDITGTLPLGNGGNGIDANNDGTVIGGPLPQDGNVIANNGGVNNGYGVRVGSKLTPILSNSIDNNQNLGISLQNGNNGQAAPVLILADSMNTVSTVDGTLTSAMGVYTVQFFSSPSLNPSGNAEGETLLATKTVTISGTSTTFSLVLPTGFTPGTYITATATDAIGNTSQFSNGVVGTGTGNGVGPPAITAMGSSPSVAAGREVTDTFTVSNPNVADDAGVTFLDTIPANVAFVSGTTSLGSTVTFAGGVASAILGTLASGQSVTVSIILATTDATRPSFTNTGEVTATSPPVLAGAVTASVTTAVTPSADLSLAVGGPTGVFAVGQDLTFVVTVKNGGPSGSTGGVVTDSLPAGSTFVSATPSFGPMPTVSGGVLTDDYGDLAVGSTFTLTIIVTAGTGSVPMATDSASVLGTEFDPDTTNNAGSASATVVVPTADLAVAVTGPSGTHAVGQSLTFKVTVTNGGPFDSTGGVLTDTLPVGVNFISATPSGGPQPTLSNGVLTDDYGDLAVGSTFTLTIVVGAGVDTAPLATDSASVMGNEGDPNIANNIASASVVVTAVADVAVTLSASSSTVGVDQPLVYTVTVADVGPSPATGLMITDVLPANVAFVSATSSSGSMPTESGGIVTDGFALLGPGEIVVITITVKPTSLAVPAIVDNAGVMANEPDPDMTNNAAAVTTFVVPIADLAITSETSSPSPAVLGQPVQLTIVVTNNGPSDATNVVLTDDLPAGLTFLSGTVIGGTVTASGGVITAPVGTLIDGATTTITIVAMTTASGTFTDMSSVKSDLTDSDLTNNLSGTTVTVVAMVDLSIVLSGNPGPAYAGDVLSYTAIVTNNGPSPATNVEFDDPLFPGATFVGVEANGVGGSVVNGVVVQPIGDLAAGQSATVVLLLIPTQVGTAVNTATVTATETDPNQGNNASTVSTVLITPQSIITFDSPAYQTTEDSGYATILLDRTGNVEQPATVQFSTVDLGFAKPGVDYVPVQYTISFPVGVGQLSVYVAVLPNPNDNHDEILALRLSDPTGIAIIGPDAAAQALATLTIIDVDPVLVGPTVTDLKLTGPVSSINVIEIDTTGHLDPTTATNAANYTITALGTGGKAGLRSGTVVPVVSATYNPFTGAIYLFPATPLPGNQVFVVVVNGSRPGAVTDLAGNPLNSVLDLTPGKDYTLTIARGTNISYSDENNDLVNLKLTGPGTIDIDRYPVGSLEKLQVVGGVANKTVVTGSIHPNRPTGIGSILGLGQFGSIRLKLTTPPFYVVNLPYPNLATQVGPPAEDTLLPPPPLAPKPAPKVKARSIESLIPPAWKKAAHDAKVHGSAAIPRHPHAGHGR